MLVTGTVGSGKTTVMEAIGKLLVDRGVPHALVDLDQLRLLWPPPTGDRFNHALELTNLCSVAANYRAAGGLRLVLAGVIEQRSAVEEYQRAVNCTLRVVRLRADPDTLADRLHHRHRHDPDGLSWHLHRAPEPC
jgi:adenylylsulfate kinase